MKARPAEPLLRDIQTLFRTGATGGLTDGELLARFVATGDEAAFEVLVHRLGPMVLGVCRRMLHDRHDAEDAFQATFLVLARRAASVDPPDRVGPWLFGVARRVADRARAVRARRRSRESAAAIVPEPAIEPSHHDDLLPLLDRELGRLPEKYRAPIVLCHLEGKPYKEAARQLGCPEGTLAGRLTRGRALLAARLNRLGVAMSAGALASVLAKEASARVPTAWAVAAVGMACGIRGRAPSALAAGVAALAKGTLRTMLMTRLRAASAAIVAVGVIGVGAAAGRGDDPKPAPKQGAEAQREQHVVLRWPSGPIHLADVVYQRGGDGPAKGDGGVSGPIRRVEAYAIGDDVYINLAPAGSGRVLLEKITKGSAPAKAAETKPPAAKPVRFTIERATLDRVNLPAGELIDIHLDNGPHDPKSPTAEQQTFVSTRDGQLMTVVSPPATRILGLPVAVGATLRIESAGAVVTTGTGEEMLGQLKPGMRLTLEVVADGPLLVVRAITARPAPQTTAAPVDPFYGYYDVFKSNEPQPKR